ncbi:MAG: hypothetical protein GY729_08710 [Desulfobacteraceae bacterium]|nr:hypothetical protein [Desulfobacteraceae bacterium]
MAKENDVVLLYLEESPVSFARVEKISPDAKKGWYHIKLLMLQIPMQTVTWILKDDYINGQQFFMGGKPMRIEKVESPKEDTLSKSLPIDDSKINDALPQKENPDAKIISFSDQKNARKKDDPDPG